MIIIPAVILAIESEDDRTYMTALYQKHYALMLKTAWVFTKERADVEDIVSDSCAALIIKLDTVRALEPSKLRSYIITTVRNTAIDFCRKQQRQNARFVQVEEGDMNQYPATDSVEGSILLMDELNMVRNALHALPEREQDILRMKCQQGLKDAQIAELIGLSESSVRKYVIRAREHLKAMIYRGVTE